MHILGLSQSVGKVLGLTEALETSRFVLMMDRFFDTVNV